MGELGPRKAVPLPTARQPLGTAGAASREDQQGATARGASSGGQHGGSPTRIQLPVPKRQSHEVLSIECVLFNAQQYCTEHACILSPSFVTAIMLSGVRPSDVACRGDVVIGLCHLLVSQQMLFGGAQAWLECLSLQGRSVLHELPILAWCVVCTLLDDLVSLAPCTVHLLLQPEQLLHHYIHH